MIGIDRRTIQIPECLRTDVESVGLEEIRRAKAYYEERARIPVKVPADGVVVTVADAVTIETPAVVKTDKSDSFEFKIYKGAKTALKELFDNKCGYCEIDYGGAASDVEHFRPKGGIDYVINGELKKHSEGYYWLAADWENLIYSCQHCNRGETHDHQLEITGPITSRVSGKANYFPLSDETKRLKACDPINGEEPFRLLLDPCRDNPQQHLRFHKDGFVTAKLIDKNNTLSPQGQASIRHYGLSRVDLKDRRKHTASTLLFAIGSLNDALSELDDPPTEQQFAKARAIVKHINSEFLAAKRPFLGMARALFAEYVDIEKLNTLV